MSTSGPRIGHPGPFPEDGEIWRKVASRSGTREGGGGKIATTAGLGDRVRSHAHFSEAFEMGVRWVREACLKRQQRY